MQGAAEAWEVLNLPGFSGREEMLVSTLNTNQILIAGGFNGTDLLSEVFILEDGETLSLTMIKNGNLPDDGTSTYFSTRPSNQFTFSFAEVAQAAHNPSE